MADTTRDYMYDYSNGYADRGWEPARCEDCARPMYYDRADETYHHAVDAATPCFLIPADDRDDDPHHPLVCSHDGVVDVSNAGTRCTCCGLTFGVRQTGVEVVLTGTDGNAFAIIGTVSRALRSAGLSDEAETFRNRATSCGSYDSLLLLAMLTCEVQ